MTAASLLGLFFAAMLAACGGRAPHRVATAPAAQDGGLGSVSPRPDAGAPKPGPDPGAPIATLCPAGVDAATTPTEYGACELIQAAAESAIDEVVRVATADDANVARTLAAFRISLDTRPESFAIFRGQDGPLVIGRDQVGAMYGAFELAERLRLDGARALALTDPILAAPAVAIRAANPFLVLPAPGETSWWFLDRDSWREYLDMLARARLNLLDLHGMYDLDNTLLPNALLYFATSRSFPDVGVARADRERNLAMLAEIIGMASLRGIRVALMSYRADTSPTGDQPATLDNDQLLQYTREAAADLATRARGLSRLGFRIGESGRPASWYIASFIAGVNDADAGVGVYTRTWWATRSDIMNIVAAAKGETIVEAKFNGEQLGAPYVIAGGEFVDLGGYSYEGFLDPPTPYSFVFQLRAGGTHRIFRFASFVRSRRTVQSLSFSPRVKGFSFEPAHAFFPQRDYYHADPADRFSPWTFRRDELSYLLFGRLSYDPSTPERVFRKQLERRVGTDALWPAVQAASEIVPWIQTANTCGPDHRNFAAELELGKDVGYWASPNDTSVGPGGCANGRHGPFDSFAIASPYETATDLVQGVATSRLSPIDVADIVLRNADMARTVAHASVDPANVEARDVVRECVALSYLGDYFGHKLRAATALAVYAKTASAPWLLFARRESDTASEAWKKLAEATSYIAPFQERLRMEQLGLLLFHWRDEVPSLANDASSIDAVAATVAASPPAFSGQLPAPAAWFATTRGQGPGLRKLEVTPRDPASPSWQVTATFARDLPAGAAVNVLWKPFDSGEAWRTVTATASAGDYVADVQGTGAGAMFAVEIVGAPGAGWRYPDVLEQTPYLTLAP